MTEILKTVASVKLSSTFLLKVSFLDNTRLWLYKNEFSELFSEKTATHAHGALYIQCICSGLHCFCAGTKSWNMHAI